MAKEEAGRIALQREQLGAAGLEKKEEELNHAMATNEIPPPKELLTLVPIPDISNMASLPSTLYEQNNSSDVAEVKQRFGIDLEKFPVHVTICDIQTKFGCVSPHSVSTQFISEVFRTFCKHV